MAKQGVAIPAYEALRRSELAGDLYQPLPEQPARGCEDHGRYHDHGTAIYFWEILVGSGVKCPHFNDGLTRNPNN
jgi:hypothetical protein